MVGHSIIPHRHHSVAVIKSVTDPCPVDHEDRHDAEGGKGHCHAFNNLHFNKTDLSEILQKSERASLQPVITWEIAIGFLIENESNIYSPPKIPDPIPSCMGSISKRGPPVFA